MNNEQTVADSWSRIVNWFREHEPAVVNMLNPGVGNAEITQLEAKLNVTLPEDFKAFYRLCNGEKEDESTDLFPSSDDFDQMGFSPLSLERVYDEWIVWKDLLEGGDFEGEQSSPAEGIRNDWWNVGWIPFAGNGGGDFHCIDLAPTSSGKKGQVIAMWHDDDERHLIASSLADYLKQLADGLESGRYIRDEDDGTVLDDE